MNLKNLYSFNQCEHFYLKKIQEKSSLNSIIKKKTSTWIDSIIKGNTLPPIEDIIKEIKSEVDDVDPKQLEKEIGLSFNSIAKWKLILNTFKSLSLEEIKYTDCNNNTFEGKLYKGIYDGKETLIKFNSSKRASSLTTAASLFYIPLMIAAEQSNLVIVTIPRTKSCNIKIETFTFDLDKKDWYFNITNTMVKRWEEVMSGNSIPTHACFNTIDLCKKCTHITCKYKGGLNVN